MSQAQSFVKEGYLLKFSESSKLWAKRYIKLSGSLVFTYKSKDEADKQMVEALCPIRKLAIYIGDQEDRKSAFGRIYYFCLHDKQTQIKFSLGCTEVEIRDAWLSTVLSIVTELFITREKERKLGSLPENAVQEEFYGAGCLNPNDLRKYTMLKSKVAQSPARAFSLDSVDDEVREKSPKSRPRRFFNLPVLSRMRRSSCPIEPSAFQPDSPKTKTKHELRK